MRLNLIALPSLLVVSLLGCDLVERHQEPTPACVNDLVDPPEGDLDTEFGNIEFTVVETTLNHRQAGEGAGCVNAIELIFYEGDNLGCSMSVAAASSLTADGYLEITSIQLRSSGKCSSFPEEIEGSYTYDELGDSGIEILGVATGERLGCYQDGLVLHLRGASLERYAGVDSSEKFVELDDTDIVVNGRMSSLGGDDQCPESDDEDDEDDEDGES
ncbi:MAG: hypothetical protein B7733_10725 [Myxococcales bacterium FL481]|nr:MAG: hypothetical protein B7733_10725 [Myxococcales bacterium FL481]